MSNPSKVTLLLGHIGGQFGSDDDRKTVLSPADC